MKEITKEEIAKRVEASCLPEEFAYFGVIDSTNEEAKRRARLGAKDFSLYTAGAQTRGKGRKGRYWSSPEGEDLYFSLLFRPDIPPECASMTTLAAALAAAKTARKYAGENCLIKWPNDIVLNTKKICGILTEMSTERGEIRWMIIGIGINLNRETFDPEIENSATSVRKETGVRVSRVDFLADYLSFFCPLYREFLQKRDLSFLREDYNALLVNAGRDVVILSGEGDRHCRARGINDLGELVVRDEEGEIHTVRSGEVSVRGVLGYV